MVVRGTRLGHSAPHRTCLARAFRAAASSCLVLWLGFLPLGQQFHLTFASHGHRLCPTHYQIEDVAEPLDPSVDESPAGPLLRDASIAERHVACPLLNWDTSRKQRLSHPESSSTPGVLRAAATVTPVAAIRMSWALILIAPKNSPPHSLV